MQITTSFFTLLVASSVPLAALAAPVPNPSPSPQAQQQQQALSVDNLLQQAKGDPMVIVQQFKPIADQIASTIQEMITLEGAHKETGAHHDSTHAHANDAHAHSTPSTPTAEKHEAAAVADPNAAAPTDSPATPDAAADAGAAAAAGGVQKRSDDPTQAASPAPTEDATHAHADAHPHADGAHPRTHPEAHSKPKDKAHHDKEHKEHKDKKDHKDKKHDKHKAKAAKAPIGRKIHTDNVKKLRDLMAKANIMQEAIERVVLNNDQSIEKMPSDKDPKGVTWGLANAPVLAFSNMFNFSKQL
ncbi:hypothetical protein CPB86DRAFT_830024 [Serendipita vermifera]|nr:hypothetical protein CPB86DRAFT_830024 [Serendipita vermifera]